MFRSCSALIDLSADILLLKRAFRGKHSHKRYVFLPWLRSTMNLRELVSRKVKTVVDNSHAKKKRAGTILALLFFPLRSNNVSGTLNAHEKESSTVTDLLPLPFVFQTFFALSGLSTLICHGCNPHLSSIKQPT